jgi:beta-lactamase superfamily II metal-dependent hydrolase
MARQSVMFAVLLAAGVSACSSGDGATGIPTTPVISIAGVTDGATYSVPVTILIDTDVGSWEAALDGQPFGSGGTVSTPGSHTLSVTARLSLVVATQVVHFTIQPPPGGELIIRMFDLGPNEFGGGGDAILVTDSTAAGSVSAIVDAGPAGANAIDPGFVSRQLTQLHIDTLAILLLTHAHSDHYGGMGPILSSVHVRRFIYNGQVRSLSSYTSVVSQAGLVADSTIVVTATRDYDLGYAATPSHLKIVPPLATFLADDTDDATLLNDGSVAARLSLGTFSMFLTGDGEVAATARWRTQFTGLVQNITVLKVGHHGANNAIFDNGFSGTSSWLAVTAPQVSIISGNGTTHPRINALNKLLGQPGNRTYCTNVHGTITIRVGRDGTYTVSVAKNADQDCVPGSDATT